MHKNQTWIWHRFRMIRLGVKNHYDEYAKDCYGKSGRHARKDGQHKRKDGNLKQN